jgi:PEP-CTERM motif
MKLRGSMWIARVAAVSAMLTVGVANAGPVVNTGFELYETLSGTTFGGVAFQGVPIGTFNFGGTIGVKAVGGTDTIVQRLAPATGAAIPTRLLDLQLMSTAPTNFGLGVGFYFMTLQSARGGPDSTGAMTIGFGPEAPPGSPHGTFDSFFDVFFDIRLGSLSGPIALSDTLRGTSAGVPWNHFPPIGALEIAGVNESLNGTNSNADSFPIGPFQNVFPTGAVQRMSVTTVPEPGSLSLLAIGVLAGVAWRRHRK